MIQSEESGVMFTIDPVTNNKSKIVIEAIYGLGEMMVQGKIIPDHYEVEKKSLRVLTKDQVPQKIMLVKRKAENKEVPVSKKLENRQKLTQAQIENLAGIGRKIERHYFFPQDIEWAVEKGKIYIVQTRPVTTIKKEEKPQIKDFISSDKKIIPILEGIAASPGIASGPVQIIKSVKEIGKVDKGEVLVTEMTNPDFVPAMKKTSAIVTDQGGRTAHAAIVSRELGIPCVVGTKEATKILKNGLVITVNGSTGKIYKGGALKPRMNGQSTISESQPQVSTYALRTATKVYVNLAEPERAQEIASLPVDGVGLLRAEFMIAQFGVHPRKVIKEKKQKAFINKIAQDIAVFCQAFNPRPVVYRATDFKTSEYRNLTGGKEFEPEEENPMIGFRGAYRYIKDPDVFEMELEALKIVRNKMNLKNLYLMIPFVRTPRELLEVKKIIAGKDLIRSSTFKLWLMVEVPSNVILLEKFIDMGIDGVSIGSNDLTMLLLGADRNNAEVASEFSERDPAVLWALEKTIKTCLRSKITCSICGQAPSDYPELVENLVKWGITSVSLNPDVAQATREVIYQAEKKLCQK
jgi:pyruvate,water dikinase